MKINEIINPTNSNYLEEGLVRTSLLNLYKLFARTVMATLGAGIGTMGGVVAAIFTVPIGVLVAGNAGVGVALYTPMALGAAIGAWLAQNQMKKEFQKGDDEQEQAYYEQEQAYSVFINGRKASGNDLNYEEAAKAIAQLAIKEHDPKTYYTIYDNRTKSVVWRYMINQDIDSEDEN